MRDFSVVRNMIPALAFALVVCASSAKVVAADNNLVNVAPSASSMIVSTPGTSAWDSSLSDTSAITNGWSGAGEHGVWEVPGDGWRIWTNADVDLTIGVSFTWTSPQKVSKIFIATYDDKDTTKPTLKNGPNGDEIVATTYANNGNNHYKNSRGQGHLFSFSPAVTLSQLYIEVGKEYAKRFQGCYEIEVWVEDAGGTDDGPVEPQEDGDDEDPVEPQEDGDDEDPVEPQEDGDDDGFVNPYADCGVSEAVSNLVKTLTWCSLGTSVTDFNDNPISDRTQGYQFYTMDKLGWSHDKLLNVGHSGSTVGIANDFPKTTAYDIYTVEFGINDWGTGHIVGTMDDYENYKYNKGVKYHLFAACYRDVIEQIRAANSNAIIVLTTPRKGYGFNGNFPDNCDDLTVASKMTGYYSPIDYSQDNCERTRLEDYAKLIRQIAAKENLVLCDWYAYAADQDNLARRSVDVALHPNDTGYEIMAQMLAPKILQAVAGAGISDDPVVPPSAEKDVVAIRNIAVATAVGTAPALPAKVAGLAADGTVVGEYAAIWNPAAAPTAEGVTTVTGAAEVNGETMGVTASIRAVSVAAGGGGDLVNVAALGNMVLTTPGYDGAQDDTSVITNGMPSSVPLNSWCNKPDGWVNWKSRATTPDVNVRFTWTSPQRVSKIFISLFDGNAAPETFQLKSGETDLEQVAGCVKSSSLDRSYTYYKINQSHNYLYTFATPVEIGELTLAVTMNGGVASMNRYVGFNEIEIWAEGEGGTVEPQTTAALTALAVDGVAVSGFAPEIRAYTIKNGTAITSAVNADGNVGITILPPSDGMARVVTLAEDGVTTGTYSVTFEDGGDGPGGEVVRTGMCIDLSLTNYAGAVIRDFPLLVRIDGAKLNLSAISRDEISFSDLRNEEDYPFEIDTWNPSGETLVWVKIPYLDSRFGLRLHFGGEQPANDEAASVWTDYEGVWHLGAAIDSAKGRATEFGVSGRATTGPIGAAWGNTEHGDAGGSRVAAFRSAFPSELTNTAFTVSGWARLNDATTSWKELVCCHQSNGNAWGLRFPKDNADAIWIDAGKNEEDRGVYRKNGMFACGEWTRFDAVYDGTRLSFYLDGQFKESFVTAHPARREWVQNLYWGGTGSTVWESNEVLGADFDECRIYGRAAEDARIAAEYWNQTCATSVTFAAPCAEKDAIIPDQPYVPPSAPKHGFTITIRGSASGRQSDSGDWRVQILDSRHIVIQYNGESDYLRDHEATGELHTEKLTDAYEMVNGAAFTVNGDGVTKVGRATTSQGQISVQDLSGRNRIMGSRQFRPVHHIFVELDSPLEENVANAVVLPDGKTLSFMLTTSTVSPLFKVNQCGYAASAGKKYVYLGGWMGTGGAFPLADCYPFEVIDERTKGVVLTGTFMKRKDDVTAWEPSLGDDVPLAGEKTLEADLSALVTPGRYFVRVAGLGRSRTFRVADEAVADQFALHMLGLYQQRCGCAKTEPYTHWTDKACHLTVYRGVEPANDDEYAKRITSSPGGASANLDHFGINFCNADVCTEKLSLPGGWHDAADYDRRPYHLQIVFELSNAYLMRPENFFDGQLAMPENANGIPDILDEADWGLKHLLAAQQADGGVGTWIETITHPTYDDSKMPSDDTDLWRYYLARATHRSTLKYCAAAANLARALRAAGTPAALERAAAYTASAVKAWTFVTESSLQVNVPMKGANGATVYYSEPNWLDPFEYVKAVVNLGAITGEASYFTNLNNTITYNPGGADHYSYNGGAQWTYALKDFFKRGEKIEWEVLDCVLTEDESLGRSGFILDELGLPLDVPESARAAYEAIKAGWTACVWRRANEAIEQMESVYAYRMPYWAPDYRAFFRGKLDWGQSCPLRRALWLCSAHFLTGEQKYLDAAHLACDFHAGCNPTGMTGTSGLGEVYPVAFLSLQSFADQIGEYIPGITPYHWSAGWERLFEPANQYGPHAGGYSDYVLETFAKPWWRRWEVAENMTISVSEYTVTETIGPCAAATGYLISPEHATANLKWRQPAKKLTDLPGFWCLP